MDLQKSPCCKSWCGASIEYFSAVSSPYCQLPPGLHQGSWLPRHLAILGYPVNFDLQLCSHTPLEEPHIRQVTKMCCCKTIEGAGVRMVKNWVLLGFIVHRWLHGRLVVQETYLPIITHHQPLKAIHRYHLHQKDHHHQKSFYTSFSTSPS